MGDVLNNAREVVNGVSDIANSAVQVSRAVAKTSVTRLTNDQVFQFPVIMDGDIDDDEKFPLIKSLEKNYAELIMIAITNNGFIDYDRYQDVNKFLRRFHNNGDLPFAFEGYTGDVQVTSAIACEGYLPEKDLKSMWISVENLLDTETINSMYTPFKHTEAKLRRALEAAQAQKLTSALEAEDKVYFRRPDYAQDTIETYNKSTKTTTKKTVNRIDKATGMIVINTDKQGNPLYQYLEAPPVGSQQYNDYVKAFGEPKPLKGWHDTDITSKIADDKQLEALRHRWELEKEQRSLKESHAKEGRERAFRIAEQKAKIEREDQVRAEQDRLKAMSTVSGSMGKDDKFNALTPTVINLTLANVKKGIGSWSQNLIIGIRAMPRILPQSVLVNNMVQACKNRAIFSFIKWTNNEIKFSDVFMGLNSARESAKGQNRWMRTLRKRALINKIPGFKLNPNTTIIITENDVHLIYEKCGVNLLDLSNVQKLMDKYFLLGFGIYDTEGKMLKIMYDGESEFTHQSMRSMMADSKKEANLLAMNRY